MQFMAEWKEKGWNVGLNNTSCDLFFQISVPMSVEFDEISKMRENADDTTSKFLHLFSYRNLKVASFWSCVFFYLISLEKYIW